MIVADPSTGGIAAPAFREGFVDTPDVRLHYIEWGDPQRPPILFLHGGSAHARWWDFVVPQLADRYRCVALDLRGHGDSGWPASLDYRLEAHATDVAAAVQALALRDVAVVGHSFGGFVAMVYAARARTYLSGLVIVDSRARVTERSARYLEALRKLPHPRYVDLDEAQRRFRLMPAGHQASPETLAHVVRHGMTQNADGIWTLKFDRRAMASTPAQEFTEALAAVECPLLVIRGEHSEILTTDGLAEFRAANPRTVTAQVDGAHHHVMLDQPRALGIAIRDFLQP